MKLFLTARSLCHWIMDDGHKTTYNQTVLNTNSYINPEILQEALFTNFELRTRTIEKQSGQYLPSLYYRASLRMKKKNRRFF